MDLLIYDLDGTLIDSKLDLACSVNATRAHMGMGPLENETVYSYVGNGAPVLIRRVLGEQATEAEVQEALEFFIEYYRDHCLDYTRLYPGVREALERLAAAGVKQAILTNKPVKISRRIMEGLKAAGFFCEIYGGNSFDHKKPHPVGVYTLLKQCGAAPERTVMVGDSSVDIRTAVNAGVKSCGVTYGFQPETLSDPKPDLLVDNMERLADFVLAQRASHVMEHL